MLQIACYKKDVLKSISETTSVLDTTLYTVAIFKHDDDDKSHLCFFNTFDFFSRELVDSHMISDDAQSILNDAELADIKNTVRDFSDCTNMLMYCLQQASESIIEEYSHNETKHEKFSNCFASFDYEL